MQWNDVTRRPPLQMLRQFAGLWLVFFLAWAGWRVWTGRPDGWALALAVLAVSVGTLGLIWPAAVRWIYTSWMVAAFPIGWVISRLVLMLLFFGMFAPMALLFRMVGRDPLRLRAQPGASNWTEKPVAADPAEYLRQF